MGSSQAETEGLGKGGEGIQTVALKREYVTEFVDYLWGFSWRCSFVYARAGDGNHGHAKRTITQQMQAIPV